MLPGLYRKFTESASSMAKIEGIFMSDSDGLKRAKVVIGLPSHRGTVVMQTLVSLMKLQQTLIRYNIESLFMNLDYAEVAHSRNAIGNNVYMTKDVTHLLFIDDDMSFEPEVILELLKSNKAIVGAICPKRNINLEKFFEVAAAGGSYEHACCEATSFVTRFIPNSTLQITDGWVPMSGIGMGVTLIRRVVFDEMVSKGVAPDRWLSDEEPHAGSGISPYRYGFFDGVYDDTIKAMLSEDLSFCHRWRELCGGEVWGNANFEIGHVGPMTFKGKYIDRLRTGKI